MTRGKRRSGEVKEPEREERRGWRDRDRHQAIQNSDLFAFLFNLP